MPFGKKTTKKKTAKKTTPGAKFAKANNKRTTKTAAKAKKTWGKTKSMAKEMAF
jgi:hypothetical protein